MEFSLSKMYDSYLNSWRIREIAYRKAILFLVSDKKAYRVIRSTLFHVKVLNDPKRFQMRF